MPESITVFQTQPGEYGFRTIYDDRNGGETVVDRTHDGNTGRPFGKADALHRAQVVADLLGYAAEVFVVESRVKAPEPATKVTATTRICNHPGCENAILPTGKSGRPAVKCDEHRVIKKEVIA